MKGIYSFYWDCGRMGNVAGMFVADIEKMEQSIGKRVYFGEILGKHSEIYGTLEQGDIELKTADQDFIFKFEEVMGEDFCEGYNPLDYLEEEG